jgi:hypothetical protein
MSETQIACEMRGLWFFACSQEHQEAAEQQHCLQLKSTEFRHAIQETDVPDSRSAESCLEAGERKDGAKLATYGGVTLYSHIHAYALE